MKKYIFFFLAIIIILLLLLLGCKPSNTPYFQEVLSEKNITFTKIRGSEEKDSISMNVPIEFKLNLNSSKIQDVKIYCRIDRKQLIQIEDFSIFNAQNDKIIYAIEDLNYNTYPKKIFISQYQHISKKQAEILIKKYNPRTSINDIKTGKDTLKLVSYKKYIQDNPQFIKEMRKVPDSLIFSIGFFEGKSKVIGEKIKWLDK
ncbi:hypothetical protein IUY40_09375 [Flavobacterium sp. ALJ2]|uniref:hypothetical protein n=1 Tax=Flavobacterium sp. ALJ2 TaxID=2786960 RepID=UPI00189DA8F1|nr:hypothetical protein [Flavobacterium sp. ALJ2]MBF7091752.1 hypothetical protein [Flavobacterium sp. ALJ2]